MGRAGGGRGASGRKKKNPSTMPPKKAAAALHPPYEQMVKAALVALKDRTGSSAQAIAKYMKANFKEHPDNMQKQLSKCLKRCVENEKLKKVKASYKLGTLKADPKPKKPVKKKVVKKKPAKKKAAKKKAAPKKAKKPAKKKAAKKKAAPKKKWAAYEAAYGATYEPPSIRAS